MLNPAPTDIAIFNNAKTNYLGALFIAFLLLASGIYMYSLGGDRGWAIFFIGLGLAMPLPIIKALLDKSPRLQLDAHGITDKQLKIGTIAWSDVNAFELKQVHKSTFITLEMDELANAKYTAHFSPMKRKVIATNKSLGLTLLNLNLNGLNAKPDVVLNTLNAFHQRYH